MEKDRYTKTLVNETCGEFEDVQLEIWDPDLELFPELAKITIQEGTLGAGDWIYLPPATLHGVSNSRESWAVSVNSLYPAAIETSRSAPSRTLRSSVSNSLLRWGNATWT